MLLQNITLNNQYPYRRRGATATNTETGYMPSQHGMGGPRQFHRFTHFGKASGFPSGYNPGIFMPLVHSEMSSAREAEITFGATATGVLGMPGVGSATFSIAASGVGALIAFGVGTASITISTNTPAMSGTINGSGSASLSITGGGNLGAIASIVGEAGFSFDGSATAYPTDDSSPLRSGTASFSFSGSLVPYAIGHMEGTTDVQTELTADGIASALWNADASSYNASGTMGNKLNTASSGGVDLNALADAVWSAAEATYLADSAEFMTKIATNKRAIVQEASGWALVVYDDDGTTPILQKALKDKTGGAIAALGAGVLAQEEASTI